MTDDSSSLEEAVIAHALLLAGAPSARVPIGAGDDMALVLAGGGRVLVAADQVIEGVHFTSATPRALVARKAVARNVSDIAAMGALPAACVAAAALPRGMGRCDAEELLAALARSAQEFDCPLVGGDTAVHALDGAPLTITVTVLASPRADGRIVRRSGAVSGDVLVVSGPLGGSFGDDGMGRHLHFTPRVAEAQALLNALGERVHAMIDISDGLGRDAARLALASGARTGRRLQARLRGDWVPLNAGASLRAGLCDGEDHELLAAVAPDALQRGLPAGWTQVGTVALPQQGDDRACLVDGAGGTEDASHLGWTHG